VFAGLELGNEKYSIPFFLSKYLSKSAFDFAPLNAMTLANSFFGVL
jgi:hypothetical protein